MAFNEEWEVLTRGLEEIDFPSLSQDEQSALTSQLVETASNIRRDIISGEFTDRKLQNRLLRVIGSLQKQITAQDRLERRQRQKPKMSRRKALNRVIDRIWRMSPNRKVF